MLTNDNLDSIKAHLEVSTNMLFEKISTLLIDEVDSDSGKKKLDDLIKSLLYKWRAKIEAFYKTHKLCKSDLEELRSHWSNLCTLKKQEIERTIPWLANQYEIKLIHSSYAIPLIKDIESSQMKLADGQNLYEFKRKLHTFWEKELPKQLRLDRFSSNLRCDQKEFLLRQFVLALIFDCGCGSKVDLIAILECLRNTFSNDRVAATELTGGLVSLYAKQSTKTGFLYNYPLRNDVYANLVFDGTSLQVKQLYLSPITLLMMVRLVNIIEWETNVDRKNSEKDLIQVLDRIIYGNDEYLDQDIELAFSEIDQETVLRSIFLKKKYRLFEHLDYTQFFMKKNALDGFLNSLSKGSINSSAIPISSLRKMEALDTSKAKNKLTKKVNDCDNLIYEIKKSASKVKLKNIRNLSTANHCAVKIKDGLIGGFKGRKKTEIIKQLSEELSALKQSYESHAFALPKDIALISVQIGVMTWYLDLLGGSLSLKSESKIALSSLDTYKSSFVYDLFIYVVSHDLDLQQMDEEDYELMYEYILHQKSVIDRRRNTHTSQNNARQVHHDSYSLAVKNIKKFHKSLIHYLGVPRVGFLDSLPSGGLQMCRTSYIAPVMFEQFKNLIAVNKYLTTQQKSILNVICVIAYRTGLRIREILGLRLSDLAMTDLRRITVGHEKYYYLTTNMPDFVKIIIRNNYHRQLKTQNAHRAVCLHEFLTQDELGTFVDFIKFRMKQPINNKILAAKDSFIFEDEFGQMILSRFVSQIAKDIFDQLFEYQPHDFSFHSFRHTAVNNLCLVLKGSNELTKVWTGYHLEQINQIKKYVLGTSDCITGQHDLWKRLAHLIGHSSIEMTANHYLHFGAMLVGDALCTSDSNKVSVSIVRALVSSRVFKKQLNTSQKVVQIQLKQIVEKLVSSSKLFQEVVYPDRFTASVVKQEIVEVPKMIDDRYQLMANFNYMIDVLSEKVSDKVITMIGEDLASQLYANRHFNHKNNVDPRSCLDRLLNYVNKYRLGNLLVNENHLIFSTFINDDFISDYFEQHIRLIDARMEVYIQSKEEYSEFQKFCSKLNIKNLYVFEQKIKVSSRDWNDIKSELKVARRKKGVSLKISNLNYKDSTCQRIFSLLFLAVVYRRCNFSQIKV